MPREVTCNGRGENGDHCCWVESVECEFLTRVNGQPRCGLFLELGSWPLVHADGRWQIAPIGQLMAREYPGFGCGDWPQNIERVVDACCWKKDRRDGDTP